MDAKNKKGRKREGKYGFLGDIRVLGAEKDSDRKYSAEDDNTFMNNTMNRFNKQKTNGRNPMKVKKFLGAMMLAGMLAGACYAQPDLMNYQGRLMDSGGAPVNGSVPVVVRVYSQESGGSVQWTENIGSVAVTNGLYSFQFGDGNLTGVLSNSTCWLEIEVDSETLSPRQQLVSVPYASRAVVAETALTAVSAENAQTVGGASPESLIPPGVVLPYAGSANPPAGWLRAYGQAVSRTTYSNLFSVISTNFGIGDGSTTFSLPDLRGRVPAGRDNMGGTSAFLLRYVIDGSTLGATGGSESHQHDLSANGQARVTISGNGLYMNRGTTTDWTVNRGASITTNAGTGTMASGAALLGTTDAQNEVPPMIILNYIIKY